MISSRDEWSDGQEEYDLANDSFFRESLSLPLTPTLGEVTAIDGDTGQLSVDIDGNDDALAWAMDGLVYAVGDVVCLLFLSPSPGSGIVVGRRGGEPTSPALSAHIADTDNPHESLEWSDWTDLDYETGWRDYDTANFSLSYRTLGDLVQMRGVFERYTGTETTIGELPGSLIPDKEQLFAVATNSGAGVVKIDDGGRIKYVAGGTDWFSLDGIVF